ncbi:MAG: sigma-54 interaction domain-containing protein [Planctomycetota bacterium]
MNADEALQALADTVERVNRQADPLAASREILRFAVEVSQARAGFLARMEGAELLWTQGLGDMEPSPKLLDRVASAVREALDGVQDAPPHMTGGAAPRGAVAVKAEAGQPPVHAYPVLDPIRGTWEGVLGLVPSPTAPPEPSEIANAVLTVLNSLLDPGRLMPEPTEVSAVAREGGSSFRYDYSEFVSRSEKLHDVFRKLDRVIGAKVPVLVCGETGTGKELIARAIHRNDPHRRHKRFYTQNCGAIPANLLESELFGYEKGAFTGADRAKKGLFEIASGSTLFLDEIGEMNVEMQTRLLRVLQEQEVVPIGATEPVKVDVRIVAATLRNLTEAIEQGDFRQDLYYRLKVVRFDLPALRERPEDIPLLADHFLRKAAREGRQRPKVLDRRDPRLMQALTSYPWPGNVRELENVIRRLAYLVPDEVITFQALAEADPHLLGEATAAAATRPVRNLDDAVEELERREIDNALRVTSGNRTHAARLLGINRRSLLRRLQKYGYAGADDEP